MHYSYRQNLIKYVFIVSCNYSNYSWIQINKFIYCVQ